MTTASSIDQRIEELDLSLFKPIRSQSSKDDRTAWLLLQRALRKVQPYIYLEVGSHLGGSIQQHLIDPRCTLIYSIDKRPLQQADDRGRVYEYQENSTERMLENLRAINADSLAKVETIDADVSEIPSGRIAIQPDFCFIDGEHTRQAALRDFAFCYRVCAPNAVIGFHDDYVILPALEQILQQLAADDVAFHAMKLPGQTFAIALRDCPIAADQGLKQHSKEGVRWLKKHRLAASIIRKLPDRLSRKTRKTFPFLLGSPKTKRFKA